MAASEEPELIGVGTSETVESEVRKDLPGGGKTLIVLLLIGVFGFIALTTGPEDSSSSEENQEIGDEDSDLALSTTTTSPRTTSSIRRTTTTTTRVVDEVGPVFEFETGWDIFVGGDGPMIRFDLDTGTTEEWGRGRAPIAVVGDYLVMSSFRNDTVNYVPLDDADADPVRILGARNFYGPQQPVIADLGPDRVWLLGGAWESQMWQLWELGDEPTLVRELPAPQNVFGPGATHPEIMGASSGGVFVSDGDTITKVADGRLMSVTETHAVVEQCESPFDCETVWFEIDSWEIDTQIRTPQVQNPYFLFLMVASPDGKYAFVYDYSDERSSGVLWNLETGEAQFDGFSEEGGGFSPDGRFAAGLLRTGKVAIIDTQTGELVQVDLEGVRGGYGRIVFAPSR